MGVFYGRGTEQFPYTNTHQLNLDWLINKDKEQDDRLTGLDSDITRIDQKDSEQDTIISNNTNRITANEGDIAGLDSAKVNRGGDTMTGNLAMSGKKVTGLGTPTDNADAVTKKYNDDIANGLESRKVNRAGDTMTGSLNMSSKKITNLGAPTGNNDAATKKYIDDLASGLESRKVNKAGDTMTGDLNMGGKKVTNLGTPTANTDASTKKYVDDKVTSLGTLLTFKGTKPNVASLPASGNNVGDVWYVEDVKSGFAWVVDTTHPNGHWEEFGPTIDLTPYLKIADLRSSEGTSTVTAMTQQATTIAVNARTRLNYSVLTGSGGNYPITNLNYYSGSSSEILKIKVEAHMTKESVEYTPVTFMFDIINGSVSGNTYYSTGSVFFELTDGQTTAPTDDKYNAKIVVEYSKLDGTITPTITQIGTGTGATYTIDSVECACLV